MNKQMSGLMIPFSLSQRSATQMPEADRVIGAKGVRGPEEGPTQDRQPSFLETMRTGDRAGAKEAWSPATSATQRGETEAVAPQRTRETVGEGPSNMLRDAQSVVSETDLVQSDQPLRLKGAEIPTVQSPSEPLGPIKQDGRVADTQERSDGLSPLILQKNLEVPIKVATSLEASPMAPEQPFRTEAVLSATSSRNALTALNTSAQTPASISADPQDTATPPPQQAKTQQEIGQIAPKAGDQSSTFRIMGETFLGPFVPKRGGMIAMDSPSTFGPIATQAPAQQSVKSDDTSRSETVDVTSTDKKQIAMGASTEGEGTNTPVQTEFKVGAISSPKAPDTPLSPGEASSGSERSSLPLSELITGLSPTAKNGSSESERLVQNSGTVIEQGSPSERPSAIANPEITSVPVQASLQSTSQISQAASLVLDNPPKIAQILDPKRDSVDLSRTTQPDTDGIARAGPAAAAGAMRPEATDPAADMGPDLKLQVRHWSSGPTDPDVAPRTTATDARPPGNSPSMTLPVNVAPPAVAALPAPAIPGTGAGGVPSSEPKTTPQTSNLNIGPGIQAAQPPAPQQVVEHDRKSTSSEAPEPPKRAKNGSHAAKLPEAPTSQVAMAIAPPAGQTSSEALSGELSLLGETDGESRFDRGERASERVIPGQTNARTAAIAASIGANLQANMPKVTGETTEILLDPEELGRVRMTLSGAENGGIVMLQVERPETLELMRRNIEQMRAELVEAGWENVEFSFGQENSPDQHKEAESDPSGWTPQEATVSAAPERLSAIEQRTAALKAGLNGLDIRL